MKTIRKLLLIAVLAVFVNLSYTDFTYAAVEDCSDCHHVDFQTESINRSVACASCHVLFTAPHNDHREFKTAGSMNTDYNLLHTMEAHKGTTDAPNSGPIVNDCEACHKMPWGNYKVSCKSCHTNVAHEKHGNVSGTPGYYMTNENPSQPITDYFGFVYKSRNISCTNSNCHSTYWSSTGIIKKPSCSNCHTTPHGSFPAANDESGVKVSPNGSNPTTHSDISIRWLFKSGDTLKKSLDGINWTSINIGTPTPGNYYTFVDPGILNWSIIYYKITDAGNKEKYFPVYPPGNNAHTNYFEDTALCASCHVTHSAEQAKLLKEQTTEDLCRTCHGLANTGSRYNVDTGEIVVAGTIDGTGLITAVDYRRANSGAFGIQSGGERYAGNLPSTWNGAKVTSSHNISSLSTSLAPGGGHNRIKLTCTSCHFSHPKVNSYRLLKMGTVEAYAVNPSATGERVNYMKNMNKGCGCHQQFINPQNSGHVSSSGIFRHSTGVAIRGPYASVNVITYQPWNLTTTLPTEYMVYNNNSYKTTGTLTGAAPTQYIENGAVFCISCHYAHGTTAIGSTKSAYDKNEDSLLNDTSTMLRRKDHNGTCQDCHRK
ncbi:MAG: hypothetical protein M0Z31_12605 [Clostridia bacterium]|nr:hypothetical protein [Clostridia bacterium]